VPSLSPPLRHSFVIGDALLRRMIPGFRRNARRARGNRFDFRWRRTIPRYLSSSTGLKNGTMFYEVEGWDSLTKGAHPDEKALWSVVPAKAECDCPTLRPEVQQKL